jgi:hypothetical protein
VRLTDNNEIMSMLTASPSFKKRTCVYTNLHKAANPYLEIKSTQETGIHARNTLLTFENITIN